MVRLSEDGFLTELSKLYGENKSRGGVTVTIKRVIPKTLNKSLPKGEKIQVPEEQMDKPLCLVRAVDTKKRKISTVVNTKDYDRFQRMFGNIIKVNMDDLKKRVKRKKQK